MGQEIADIIGNTIYCCLEFFFRKGTATESSLHCKQSNRFYLFVYADAGRNKIRILTEKQNSFWNMQNKGKNIDRKLEF